MLLALVEEANQSMIGPGSLKDRLIAAAPLPMDSSGEIHRGGVQCLVERLGNSPIDGVAVDTWLGRGSRLSTIQRASLLDAWRLGLDGNRWMIAMVGAPPEIRRPHEVFEFASKMAHHAADLGADALLVDPPGAVRGQPDRDRLILEYHSMIAQAGLPMIVSYRREVLGGIGYGPEVLAQLLSRPETLGVEITTLDGISTFQQVESLVRNLAPSKQVISGEERFLGYSLMAGADALMVGMGSVRPELVRELVDAHVTKDASSFLERSNKLDRLARTIFAPPIESSGLRLLWALVQSGSLPFEAAHDPWTVRPDRTQFDRLGDSIRAIDQDGP